MTADNGSVKLPAPYYDDGRCVIYHAGCRDVLPGLSADVVLTDLPFANGTDYGATYTDDQANLDALIAGALPLMRVAAPVVALTCGIANMWRYPAPSWVLSWQQSANASGRTPWGFNLWQPLLVYGPDPYLRRGLGCRPDVVLSPNANGYEWAAFRDNVAHPCPKPIKPWRAILLRVSPSEADVVLDPFMGSGSTLVAAKYTGRRAIGVEVNERYCELAARRLAQEVLPFEEVAEPQLVQLPGL